MEPHPHGHDRHRRSSQGLLVDCDCCVVRGDACGDCVVTHLLGGPPAPLELDGDEVGALDALAGLGMVPPLRLVTAVSTGVPHGAAQESASRSAPETLH